MTLDAPDTAERGRRGRGCAVAAAAMIVLAGLGGLAAHLYDRHWEKKVEAKLAEYRAAGQPVTWPEVLAALPRIPDEDNSALVLLDAFADMAEPSSDAADTIFWDYRLRLCEGARRSERASDLVRAHLDRNARALAAIYRAALLERGRFPYDPAADLYLWPWRSHRRCIPSALSSGCRRTRRQRRTAAPRSRPGASGRRIHGCSAGRSASGPSAARSDPCGGSRRTPPLRNPGHRSGRCR